MFSTLAVVGLAAVSATLFGIAASFLMSRASNRSPAWNIALGGMAALTMALVLYLLVVLAERAAFG